MNKMQKIMYAALIIDVAAVLVIAFKVQDKELQSLLYYINGAVMLLVFFIGLVNLVVRIIRKRERITEEILRTIIFIPIYASLCALSFAPSSNAASLTMAISGALSLLFLLIWYIIRRIMKKSNKCAGSGKKLEEQIHVNKLSED